MAEDGGVNAKRRANAFEAGFVATGAGHDAAAPHPPATIDEVDLAGPVFVFAQQARQIDVLLSQGQPAAEAIRTIEVTAVSEASVPMQLRAF